MISRTLIQVIAVVVSIVFVAGTLLTSGTPDTSFLRFFSVAVFAATIVIFAWDKWLWKLPVSQMIPSVARNVSGTWETFLESMWVDPSTNQVIEPKTVYVVIRQTSSQTSVTLISNESKSKSALARLVLEDGSWILHYIYTNQPLLDLQHRSPIHHGSGVLEVVGNPARRIAGSYWTDRNSRGKLSLARRSPKLAEDFEEALQLLSHR